MPEMCIRDRMNKDLTHLMKIVDRFSKIGSETPLTPANINEVVGESVMYLSLIHIYNAQGDEIF